MSAATYFIQSCPTCGRRLKIRLEHMGREVSCYHCSARFPADCSPTPTGHSYAADVLARADALLENYTMAALGAGPSK